MKLVLKISATNGTIYKSSPPKIIHHQTIPPHRHPQIVSVVAGLGVSQWIFGSGMVCIDLPAKSYIWHLYIWQYRPPRTDKKFLDKKP